MPASPLRGNAKRTASSSSRTPCWSRPFACTVNTASPRCRSPAMPATNAQTSGSKWSFRLGGASRTTKQPHNKQQHHGPDEGHEDCPCQSAKGRAPSHLSEKPAAEHCPQNANDDVTQQAVTDAAHHQR